MIHRVSGTPADPAHHQSDKAEKGWRNDMNRILRLLAFPWVIALGSCATQETPPGSPSHVGASYRAPHAGALVLLIHVPAAEPLYRPGDAAAKRLVANALVAHGWRVGFIEQADFDAALGHELRGLVTRTSTLTVGEVEAAEARALATVAQVACERTGSPLLLRTRLLSRVTHVWQSVAHWDGHKEQIQFLGTDRVLANIQGAGPGVSLEVAAFNPAGQLVARTYGGVTLSYVVKDASGVAVDRENLFAADTSLAEGVKRAVAPLLAR